MNILILRALAQQYRCYGDHLKVECPTGSEMTCSKSRRSWGGGWPRPFTDDEHGRRPVFGRVEKFQTDPYWHDLLLLHEYFHGDNGAGIGASHQTGWTGLVALLFAGADGFRSAMAPPAAATTWSACRCVCLLI